VRVLAAKTKNKLKEIRESAGLTQGQVAKIFKGKYGKHEMTDKHISKWEREVVDPSLDNALILSEILNCTVNELFSRR
jgi:DNA-binding XRE family transcriptional regulator